MSAFFVYYGDKGRRADIFAESAREAWGRFHAMTGLKADAPFMLPARSQDTAYPTELTPAGEQAVIPGCERNASPRAKQLDLF